MQSLARKNEWPLDKVNLTVDVTKKFKEEFNQPAREGAYVYGLYMEGRQTVCVLFAGTRAELLHKILFKKKRERENTIVKCFFPPDLRCKMGHSDWCDH